jgi:outer membrane phospholipase A
VVLAGKVAGNLGGQSGLSHTSLGVGDNDDWHEWNLLQNGVLMIATSATQEPKPWTTVLGRHQNVT